MALSALGKFLGATGLNLLHCDRFLLEKLHSELPGFDLKEIGGNITLINGGC